MANPLFPVTAACRLDITAGAASRAAYYALAALYQFGVPVIPNRAPAELATTIGVPLYNNPGDPGINNSTPGVVVVSFPYATPQVVVGGIAYPVDVHLPGGTLVGVNYVDPNGVLHPDVDWQWAISVEAYLNGATGDLGKWNQQLITYVGDGTSGRLIPTPFPLNVGTGLVWIFPQDVGQPSFRHTGMTGTVMSAEPLSTVGGIMAFTASGFTVTDDAPNSLFVNTSGKTYTALVLWDNTVDQRYMRVGSYLGWPAIGPIIQTCQVNGIILGTVTPQAIGQTVAYTGGANPSNGVVATRIDGSHYTATGAPHDGNNYFATAVVGNRAIASGGVKPPTQAWVLGPSAQCSFTSDDLPVGSAVSFGIAAATLTDQILGLSAATLSIGVNPITNGGSFAYYFVLFSIPVGDAVRALFQTYKATGTGGVVTVPLAFPPAFATARPFTTGLPVSVWRSPTHTGTTSTQFDTAPVAANGIRAFGAASLDLGSGAAPAATDVYGFALVASGSVTVPKPPVYTLVVNPPPATPGGPGVPLPIPAGSAGGGCGSDLASAAATTAGTAGCAR